MICTLCPRSCGAERTETVPGGVCGQPLTPVAAKAMLHQWEEPCLVGVHGAGCVFFSGRNLRRCFSAKTTPFPFRGRESPSARRVCGKFTGS